MKFYFVLQFRMLNRYLSDTGIRPVFGYILVPLIFLGVSLYMFNKFDQISSSDTTAKENPAQYFFALACLILISKLSNTDRNNFIRSCFPDNKYFRIRLMENSTVAFPFEMFLIYKGHFLTALILLIASLGLAFYSFRNKFSFIIPTPFFRFPFEFTAGFRNTFYLFPIAYFLTFIAITVNNFHLGIIALLFIFLTCYTFYFEPEDEYGVWVFTSGPGKFLRSKIRMAFLYSTILILPVVICLGIYFPDKIFTVLSFLSFGYLYLFTFLFAKYSIFPDKLNLLHVIVIAFSAGFPFLLLIIIPYFYLKSIKSLREILA